MYVRLSKCDVERLSPKIAREKKNQEYAISHAFTPSIYKL